MSPARPGVRVTGSLNPVAGRRAPARSRPTRATSGDVPVATILAAGPRVNAPRSGASASGFGITLANDGETAGAARLTTSPAATSGTASTTEAAWPPHPRTAPAVSPNMILRCTSRKNTMTGIAVSVEAAINPPQSVFWLVP